MPLEQLYGATGACPHFCQLCLSARYCEQSWPHLLMLSQINWLIWVVAPPTLMLDCRNILFILVLKYGHKFLQIYRRDGIKVSGLHHSFFIFSFYKKIKVKELTVFNFQATHQSRHEVLFFYCKALKFTQYLRLLVWDKPVLERIVEGCCRIKTSL